MLQLFIFFTIFPFMCQLNCCISKPLFLTPLIEKGEIRTAQRRAEVKPFLPNVKSYSGYLTVDKEYNSNVFFWFFPKTSNWTEAPLMLWLHGGNGASSLFAVFHESGPYIFDNDELKRRKHSWTKFCNLLYIDVPVGTGFSFSDSFRGYGGNHSEVGGHVFQVLKQFLLLFPKLQKNKLILSSESYGAKFLVSLVHNILTKPTKPKINVWKIFMCSPWLNFGDMLPHFSSYFEAHGLLDGSGRNSVRQQEDLAHSYVKAKAWDKAYEEYQNIFLKDSLIFKLTGLKSRMNILTDIQPSSDYFLFEDYINRNESKAALHVRNEKYFARNRSLTNNQKDFVNPVTDEFGIVLDNFRTLTFFGQFDILTPYLTHTKVMENLDWSGNWDYTRAHRQSFRHKQHLCGYYKTAKKYTEVMIRTAGHLIPEDQPQCTRWLLLNYIRGDLD